MGVKASSQSSRTRNYPIAREKPAQAFSIRKNPTPEALSAGLPPSVTADTSLAGMYAVAVVFAGIVTCTVRTSGLDGPLAGNSAITGIVDSIGPDNVADDRRFQKEVLESRGRRIGTNTGNAAHEPLADAGKAAVNHGITVGAQSSGQVSSPLPMKKP